MSSASGSVPPRSIKCLARSLAIKAPSASLISLFLSLIPVSSDASSKAASSIVIEVLIVMVMCIKFYAGLKSFKIINYLISIT